MKVAAIDWISKEGAEAEVRLTAADGLEISVFCHPCRFRDGDTIRGTLFTLDAGNIQVVPNTQLPGVKKVGPGFECRIVGTVTDVQMGTVSVGETSIKLDSPFPGDVAKGDFIGFDCSRIDVWEQSSTG